MTTKILGLTEAELFVALKNVGCFIETCGACAETFYSGATYLSHECGKKLAPVRVIFDGPPGHKSGSFVEVEDMEGRGVSVGVWKELSGGLWSLDGLWAEIIVSPKQADLLQEQIEVIRDSVAHAMTELIEPTLADIQDSTVTILTGYAISCFLMLDKPVPPVELVEQEIFKMREAAREAATNLDLNK